MDETRELLHAVLGGLKEVSAKVDGVEKRVVDLDARVAGVERGLTDLQGQVTGLQGQVTDLQGEFSEFRRETNTRLDRMEQGMAFQREKWMEHDEEIWKLKRKQA